MPAKLSGPMLAMLQRIAKTGSWANTCATGGLNEPVWPVKTLESLRNRGFVDEQENLTAAGRQMIGRFGEPPAATANPGA